MVEATGEVFGDAPDIAARVQGLADPGTVLVTANVQRQTAGLFVAEDRGAHASSTACPRRSRCTASCARAAAGAPAPRALTPLVGREEELELLRRRWERTPRWRRASSHSLSANPASASRASWRSFARRLARRPHTFVELSSSQMLQNTPLHPIAEWGRQRFGAGEPADRRFADLENTLRLDRP